MTKKKLIVNFNFVNYSLFTPVLKVFVLINKATNFKLGYCEIVENTSRADSLTRYFCSNGFV